MAEGASRVSRVRVLMPTQQAPSTVEGRKAVIVVRSSRVGPHAGLAHAETGALDVDTMLA